MTALDVFKRFADGRKKLSRIEEKIERRRALQISCTSKPMEADSGSHGSGDASMRLLDYVADVDELLDERDAIRHEMETDRACCIYLAECMPDVIGKIMIEIYIGGATMKACADAIGYSVSHMRRLRTEAEDFAGKTVLTYWDGNHIPIIKLPDDVQNYHMGGET